jgi:hypothetical protein
MSTAEKAENRPANPAPGDRQRQKEPIDVVLAHQGGKTYEIPLNVAQQYESQDTHDEAGDDEVGGRHRTQTPMGFVFHSDWQYGSYVWITNGQTYRGDYHWHPNPYSPYAYDMDNY